MNSPSYKSSRHAPSRSMQRWLRTCCLSLVVTVGTFAGAGAAFGASGHVFLSSIAEGQVGESLVGLSSVAVDDVSGRVFVADAGAGYVDVYSRSGEFVTQFGEGVVEAAGVAVDEASGEVFVADSIDDAVLVYAPAGEEDYVLAGRWTGAAVPGGRFGEVAGVAVDNSGSTSSGDVYVLEATARSTGVGEVDVFRQSVDPGEEGSYIGRLSGAKLERPNGIAVSGGSGRVLVADSVKSEVLAFSAAGMFEEKLSGKGSPFGSFKGGEEGENVADVAVDPATEDVYVAEAGRHVVSQYSASDEWLGWITSGQNGESLGEPRGVTVEASGDVLVADAGTAAIDRYGPEAVVPNVETGKVAKSGLTRTTALLTGTVDGEGKAVEYRLQYGETSALGSETASHEGGGGESSVSIEATGLAPERAYFYRIVAENEDGSNVGLIHEFVTPAAVEGVSTGPAGAVDREGATLTGTLTPGGMDAHYYFEWGLTSSYGNSTPVPPGIDAGAGIRPVEVSVVLGGLQENALYHYRIVAENSFGRTYGFDRTFTTSGPPTIAYEAATGVGQEGVTVHASVDPDGFATSYRVEYGESTSYGSEAPVGGEAIGSGVTPVHIVVALTDLKVGAIYHYRVVAVSEAGTTDGSDQTVATLSSAPIEASYASNIHASEVTLNAQVNPLGDETSYYFQYGTEDCAANPADCADTPLAPGRDIGAGSEGVAVSATLTDLSPGVSYYYRVVASNSRGVTEGPEGTFTTQTQAGGLVLPDGRAWEMVTPPNKGSAPTEALTREGGVIRASEDGDRLTYVVDGALGEDVEGNRSPEWQQILATRGPSGWVSRDIATPNSRAEGIETGNPPEYQFFDPELSTALVEPFETEADPELVPGVTQATIYLHNDDTGTYAPLVSEANTPAGTDFSSKVHFISATPDLQHVVLGSTVALTGEGSAPGLYEWSEGRLKFVSVLPHSIKPAPVAELGFFGNVVTNAISSDGSRVIWSSKDENAGRGRLYMRDTAKGETLRLDVAQEGVVEPSEASAQFQAANTDDSRVFFTDKQRLTANSNAEPGKAQEAGKADLYECEIVEVAGKLTCDLKDLTVPQNEGEPAAVQGFILGADESGTNLYFVAHGVLATDHNGNGEVAQAGEDNLYAMRDESSGWTTTFIATLSSEDGPEWEGNRVNDTAYLTARVAPNGRYLAFMSAAPITGYDNVEANPAAKGARAEEVYLYDSTTDSLRCVSCDPTGARPQGVLDNAESGEGLGLLVDRRLIWGQEGKEHWLAGSIPGWTAQSLTSALFQSRYLTDEGRLYFDSPDDLVPAAENGKEDVYEYEPAGVGSCESATGGCVSLISGGSSDRESAFIEATPDGSNVFFLTDAQLLPQDTDTAFDIYDARECTPASPCLTPPSTPPAPCAETQTCRPAPSAQTIPAPLTAASVPASGNVVSRPTPPAQHETLAKKASKPLTRAQMLARALASCRKQHPHSKRERQNCERLARRRYASKHRASAKTKRGKSKPSTTDRHAERARG